MLSGVWQILEGVRIRKKKKLRFTASVLGPSEFALFIFSLLFCTSVNKSRVRFRFLNFA